MGISNQTRKSPNNSPCYSQGGGKEKLQMKTEKATGETTVNGSKVEYNVTLKLPESLEEYETFTVKDGRGEDARENTMKAIVDYERRYQRQQARPSESKGTGIRKISKALNAKLKAGEISEEQLNAAMVGLGIEL
jgi:hypothetical protein